MTQCKYCRDEAALNERDLCEICDRDAREFWARFLRYPADAARDDSSFAELFTFAAGVGFALIVAAMVLIKKGWAV